jgi:small subunit ribosomal protein S8
MTYRSQLFTSLQNGQKRQKDWVAVRVNKNCLALLRLLQNQGFIGGFTPRIPTNESKRKIRQNQLSIVWVALKYRHKQPAITQIQQISTSGRQVYVTLKYLTQLPSYPCWILSTSQGLITHEQALRAGLGGELLCQIQ